MLSGSAANIDKVPSRAFEQDIGSTLCAYTGFAFRHFAGFHLNAFCIQDFSGGIVHFAFSSAHYTCYRERALIITNQHVHGREPAVDAIEGGKFFAVFCRAGGDPHRIRARAFLEHVVVEGMERLAKLKHCIVGGIHNAVDGAHARQLKPPLDLIGAGFDLYISDEPKHKTRVEIGLGDLDI